MTTTMVVAAELPPPPPLEESSDSMLVSQVEPAHPAAQLQLKPSTRSVQDPEFLHGPVAHALMVKLVLGRMVDSVVATMGVSQSEPLQP